MHYTCGKNTPHEFDGLVDMKIVNCKINHLRNPLGYALDKTVFSYEIQASKGSFQTEGRLKIGLDQNLKDLVFDSGWDSQMDSLAYPVHLDLKPRTRYYWTVSAKTDGGEECTSEVNWFETAKMQEPWQGKWIGCGDNNGRHPIFEKAIEAPKKVAAARLYICGLGLYRAYWNDEPIGDELLTPYCNNYHQWLQYQPYDVTHMISGNGMLRVLLGNGWYKGRFGFNSRPGGKGIYGDQWKLIAELRILYEDGSESVVGTDESWTVKRSRITASSIYDGECVDMTLPELDVEQSVLLSEATRLTARYSIPVKVQQRLKPVAMLKTTSGETVFDLGQNHTGIFEMRVHEPAGRCIRLQFGETLQNDSF